MKVTVPSYFHEILQVIHTEAEAASQGVRFMLTKRFKLELALELLKEAANHFKKMCIAFKTANSPVLYLESKKKKNALLILSWLTKTSKILTDVLRGKEFLLLYEPG